MNFLIYAQNTINTINKMDHTVMAIITLIIIYVWMTRDLFTKSKKSIEHYTDESLQNIASLIERNFIFVAGMIVAWSGSIKNIPKGWALCDGKNGRPDLHDRFILGTTTEELLKKQGGQNQVTLTIDNMPVHTHKVNDPGHRHQYYVASDDDDFNKHADWGQPGNIKTPSTSKSTTGIKIENTGGGLPHNNMPPFYRLAYIIKLP